VPFLAIGKAISSSGQGIGTVATLVERSSRFVMLVGLPTSHTADVVADALAAKIAELPAQLRRSLTWDQGKEMAAHSQFTVASGVPVFFCDPRSPWQRGTNENTNGLLRQYLPRKSRVAERSQEELDAIAAELNGRPRKTLDYRTPAQALETVLP
jgi:IS30 family transposase